MNDYFKEKISHLLNVDKKNPKFIVCGGLQGAGKSTLVKEFENKGYIVVCPDRIRVELAKKDYGEDKLEGELQEYLQSYSHKAFQLAEKRIKEHLLKGKSVIFDAVNATMKRRKQTLRYVNKIDCQKVAVYIECPLDIAINRNIKRSKTITGTNHNGENVYGRYVPQHIIELKNKYQTLPTIKEGFDEINILHVGLNNRKKDNIINILNELKLSNNLNEKLNNMKNKNKLAELFPTLNKCWGLSQDNKNHNYKMHEHMIKAAKYLQNESLELFVAALLHDIGKYDTKTFFGKLKIDTNQFKKGEKVIFDNVKSPINDQKGFIKVKKIDYKKGYRSELLTIKHIDKDENAHYYEHHIIGAIIARRELIELGLDEKFAHKIYEYILHHMDLPFQECSNKHARKLAKKFNNNLLFDLIKLRKADKIASGNGGKYLELIHDKNVEKIKKYL